LAYCWRPRQYGTGTPAFAEGNVLEAEADVSRLRRECDAVIVSLHWGDEFLGAPADRQVAAAARMVDAGAALVVGHHPHVLGPIQRLQEGVVAYSLGNFSSDMLWMPELRLGGAIRCTLDGRRAASCSTNLVRVQDDFRSTVVEGEVPTLKGTGLTSSDYATAVHRTLRHQRRRSYVYALKNVHRFRAPVLVELLSRTVRNKLHALASGGPT
jgi:hypothetical protein